MKAEYAGYLIRKRGYYYRPDFAGYTSNKFEAGRYTKDQAERECSIEPENFSLEVAPEVEGRSAFLDEFMRILSGGMS